ncbi:hypothetical protein CRUP_022688, partial [Coryphaenoides rupestris]
SSVQTSCCDSPDIHHQTQQHSRRIERTNRTRRPQGVGDPRLQTIPGEGRPSCPRVRCHPTPGSGPHHHHPPPADDWLPPPPHPLQAEEDPPPHHGGVRLPHQRHVP